MEIFFWETRIFLFPTNKAFVSLRFCVYCGIILYMKRKIATILSCLLAVGGLALSGGLVSASVKGEEASHTERLFLPASYEQYLPLEDPTDVAVTSDRIAVADGNTVYVYTRATNEYKCYTHDKNVNELQFSGSSLYFLDQGMNLFSVNADALPQEPILTQNAVQHCISFTISADLIYFTKSSGNIAKIYSAPLTNPMNEKTESGEIPTNTNPALTVSDGKLYYTDDGTNSHLYPLDQNQEIDLQHHAINSIAIDNGILYYTASGSFYAYRLSDLMNEDAPVSVFSHSSDYSAITGADDGYIYAVCGSSIKQYDPEKNGFTDYEIADSSAAQNRLSGATDSVLTGELLITADAGNSRISVTDVNGKTTRTIDSIAGDMISSNGKTALVANATQAALYDLKTGETLQSFPSFASPLVGVTNVYGTYYFATETGFGKITEENKLSAITPVTNGTPRMLCSDVYGEIYVGFASGAVFRYTEEEYLNVNTKREEADKLTTLPSNTKKLLVDFERNLYALKNGELHVYKNEAWQIRSLAKSVVYSQNAQTPVNSLCFGVETNQAYLMYAGNFFVETDEFALPTLSSVPTLNADEQVFGESGEFSLVRIAKNTLYIHFDIERLNGATVFPYLRHERKESEKTALKLGEAGRFDLVAVFEEDTRQYVAALVERRSCLEELNETEFLKPAEEFTEDKTGYTTNALPLYKFPYLTDLLTVCELPKNAELTVLGEIGELDYRYYRVSYVDEQGITRTGYVPQPYVSSFDGRYPTAEKVTAGDKETDYDSLWRAAFILLGCSAIAILTDFLILKKKK